MDELGRHQVAQKLTPHKALVFTGTECDKSAATLVSLLNVWFAQYNPTADF